MKGNIFFLIQDGGGELEFASEGEAIMVVFASAYTAAIEPHILLMCSRVGLPNIHCSVFVSNFCTAVSCADVMVKFLLCL